MYHHPTKTSAQSSSSGRQQLDAIRRTGNQTTAGADALLNATSTRVAVPAHEQQQRQQPETQPKMTAAVLALCLSVGSVTYTVLSVLPYSGYMALHLMDKKTSKDNNPDTAAATGIALTTDTIGWYAGILSSAWHVGSACSASAWSRAADRYGRMTTLSLALVWSSLFSLAFGLASSSTAAPSSAFWLAVTWRFCGGLTGGGVIGIAKTLALETSPTKAQEAYVMKHLLKMWGWGYLIAPAVGGMLAEPLQQYSELHWDTDVWYVRLIQQFPFLLPNLISVGVGALALVAVAAFVTETLPKNTVRPLHNVPSDLWAH
jgi:MFS family permease